MLAFCQSFDKGLILERSALLLFTGMMINFNHRQVDISTCLFLFADTFKSFPENYLSISLLHILCLNDIVTVSLCKYFHFIYHNVGMKFLYDKI